MPYTSIDELPASVRKLSTHAQNIFMRTFNSVYEEDGKESRAFAIAWTQAKKAEIKKALDAYRKDKASSYDPETDTININMKETGTNPKEKDMEESKKFIRRYNHETRHKAQFSGLSDEEKKKTHEQHKKRPTFGIIEQDAEDAEDESRDRIKKALDGINYYIIGKQMDVATLTSCPAGKHAHSTYAGGKCHDMTIMHQAHMKLDNRLLGMKGMKHASPAKGRPEMMTEEQTEDTFIRKARKELAQLFLNEQDAKLKKVYHKMALQANELLKEESVENWGVFYKMLETATKQFPEVKVLRDMFNEVRDVEVDV